MLLVKYISKREEKKDYFAVFTFLLLTLSVTVKALSFIPDLINKQYVYVNEGEIDVNFLYGLE